MKINIDENINLEFARIITDIYKSIEVKNYKDRNDYNDKLNKRFKLDQNKYEHNVIESCRFLLEDSEMAIINFLEYGIQGPTKYEDVGESYLRLYGLLNAIYLQISIPITLIEVFKLDSTCNKKELNKEFNSLKIIDFRHKVAAHSLNYKKGQNSNYYRISQITLQSEEITILNKESTEQINIIEELKNYRSYYYSVIYKVLKLITKKLLEKESNIYKQIIEELNINLKKSEGEMFFEILDEEKEIAKINHKIDRLKDKINCLELMKSKKNADVQQ